MSRPPRPDPGRSRRADAPVRFDGEINLRGRVRIDRDGDAGGTMDIRRRVTGSAR